MAVVAIPPAILRSFPLVRGDATKVYVMSFTDERTEDSERIPACYDTYDKGKPTEYNVYWSAPLKSGWKGTVVSVRTKGYKSSPKSNRYIPGTKIPVMNPFSLLKRTSWTRWAQLESYQYRSMSTGAIGSSISYYRTPSSWYNDYPEFDKSVHDAAVTNAYANMNAPFVPGLTWLGEAKESIMSLKGPLKALRDNDIPGWLRNLGSSSLKNPTKGMADAWTTVAFGILPTIGMVQDVMKALSELDKEKVLKANGFHESKDRDVENHSRSVWKYYNLTSHSVRESSFRAGCTLYFRMTRQETPAEKYGFTLYDAMLAAWQLTGYSFVADWLFNIGEVLASYRPMGNQVIQSAVTEVADNRISCHLDKYDSRGKECAFRGDRRLYERRLSQVRRTLDPEKPVLPTPVWETSAFKVISGVALLAQQAAKNWR